MNPTSSPFDKQAKAAFVVACIVLFASSLSFDWAVKAFNVYLRKERVELRGSFDTIPRTIGRWKAIGEDKILGPEMIESLGTDIYLDRLYASQGNHYSGGLHLHVAYYTGMIDTVPHVPERCFGAAGFNLKSQPENLKLEIDRGGWWKDPEYTNLRTGESYWLAGVPDVFTGKIQAVRMPVGEFSLRTTEFEDPTKPTLRIFGGYFFVANGRSVWTPTDVKAIAFDPSERFAYYCKVQLTYIATDATAEKFAGMASEFLREFLPELMQQLPDWAEVERRADPSKPDSLSNAKGRD